MLRKLLTVGGFTLLSRATGFARDIVMSAVLGAGALNDAFVVAFKLPNHFRAIFAEGAFNAAFTPTYARALASEGAFRARQFASRIYSLLVVTQLALLALALVFTPQLVDLLAPGFRDDPAKFELTVNLTRITFPYLFFIVLTTLNSGALNSVDRFAAAAFAPVLLNLSMIAALAVAFLFPNAGYAAAVGVTISGLLQWLLTEIAARRARVGCWLAAPGKDPDVKSFFKMLGPAVIGSAGPQIAVFADTIIGSLLPTGGPSQIYYADRIYQLPIGVIGIAAGTVLVPEMSRRLAGGDEAGAHQAQSRTMALTIALALPFVVAFFMLPDLIMEAAFARGRFTVADARAAAQALSAYGAGLMAMALISSMRASFQAREDMVAPMFAALAAIAVNIALKVALFRPFGAAGIAFATSVGAWVNFLALLFLATRRGHFAPSAQFARALAAACAAGLALAGAAVVLPPLAGALVRPLPLLARETQMALVAFAGLAVYGGVFYGAGRALGFNPLAMRARGRRSAPDADPAA